MESLWGIFIAACKSRLSAIARSLFLGRERAKTKIREFKNLITQLRESARQSQTRIAKLEAENERLRTKAAELEIQSELLRNMPPTNLPIGEVPPGQQFGAGMACLCVNLARRIGLRPTVEALDIFFVVERVTEGAAVSNDSRLDAAARLGSDARSEQDPRRRLVGGSQQPDRQRESIDDPTRSRLAAG